jgi:L-ascorbate metabolism protein UlaG (beta-lactamase superfamily)
MAACGYLFLLYAARGYEGRVSDHFDGSHFFNPDSGGHSFGDMVKWLWEMQTVSWPEWIDDPGQPSPPEIVASGKLRVTYVNHATVLIQIDSLNILTDPIWSMRAGPTSWLGTKRVRNPGITLERLPKVDVVLISHDHYDHLDMPSLERIVERDHPMILVGLGVEALLPDKWHDLVRGMDWWETHTCEGSGTVFTFVPARHSSGRFPFREDLTLWGGFMIESRTGDQVYFAGDTGFGRFLESMRNRFEQIRLAILPVGNYEKRWFMKDQHMSPDDAVQAMLLLGAHKCVGIHFSTFAEHPEQAIDAHDENLATALDKYRVPPSDFWLLKFGEGRDVPAYRPGNSGPISFRLPDEDAAVVRRIGDSGK